MTCCAVPWPLSSLLPSQGRYYGGSDQQARFFRRLGRAFVRVGLMDEVRAGPGWMSGSLSVKEAVSGDHGLCACGLCVPCVWLSACRCACVSYAVCVAFWVQVWGCCSCSHTAGCFRGGVLSNLEYKSAQ